MKYICIVFLVLGLVACDSNNTGEDNEAGAAGMGGVAGGAGTGGESGSAGAFACGASACGPCEPGCRATDQCVDGNWLCGCDCGDNEGSEDDCGGASCLDRCLQGCSVVSECVDGMLQCDCDCSNGGGPPLPPCMELCRAWTLNLQRCVDGFVAEELYGEACRTQCESLPSFRARATFADCTNQNQACETVLEECSQFLPGDD